LNREFEVDRFAGKVAVVTGAASGIGLALCRAFGDQGMKVVLADVQADALEGARSALEKRGVEALAVRTDVSRADDVRNLAERTLDAFGGVHVVCNNAGVFAAGLSWESPVEDYEWVLGVNLWGVIHGVRSFVPILLAQGGEGHIVNTASMAALTSMPYSAAYCMSKHAVLALSESLYHELRQRQAKIGVSALCPEVIATNIHRSERNRPEHLRAKDESGSPERDMVQKALDDTLHLGVPPDVIAERVLRGIRENRFYILAEDAWLDTCHARLDDIREGRNPTFAPPVDAR
jgi:NAD(P)-dependent dehydrogenase (short-subunit alcohol dehydrogenase family)